MRTPKPCPSCGSYNCGPDEDGYLTCLDCGGPTYCPSCLDPVHTGGVEGGEGFACLVCGREYHARCLPINTGGSDIICLECLTKETPSAA